MPVLHSRNELSLVSLGELHFGDTWDTSVLGTEHGRIRPQTGSSAALFCTQAGEEQESPAQARGPWGAITAARTLGASSWVWASLPPAELSLQSPLQ